MAKAKAKQPTDFESSLGDLEQAVEALESGDLGLDEALAVYARGVDLLARCQGLLTAADRRVALLAGLDEDGVPVAVPFDTESPASPEPASNGRAERAAPADDDDLPF